MTSRLPLYVLLAVAGMGLYCAGDSNGAARERGKVIQARVDTAFIEVRRTDTVYRQTVKTLSKVLTVYDSVRVRDTIVVTRDSISVVYVERSAADSAINVCRRLILTCEARVAATDSLVNGLRDQVRWERSQRPSTFWTWVKLAGAFGAGYVSGR